MTSIALGVYTYAEFFGCAVAILPAMAVARVVHRNDPTLRTPGRWMRRFGRCTSLLTPVWRFSVDGEGPSDISHRPYVVIANHESTADPFLLSWLPWDMRWVAKEELFHLPLIGLLMRLGGDIPLRRGAGESVREMMEECSKTLSNGLSVMVFPEGTRSPDGQLLPFKDGAFSLAIRNQVPILPVALAGTKNCRPKNSLWFGRAHAHARALAPIPTTGMTQADLPRLKAAARAALEAEIPRVRDRVEEIRKSRGLPAESPYPQTTVDDGIDEPMYALSQD